MNWKASPTELKNDFGSNGKIDPCSAGNIYRSINVAVFKDRGGIDGSYGGFGKPAF